MKKFFLLMLSVFAFCAADAQVTTSGMNGTVTDADGQTVPPAAGTWFLAIAFRNPLTLVVYLIGFVALWFHMTHGFWSMMQTVGWNNDTWMCRLKTIGNAWVSIVIALFIAEAIVFTVQAHRGVYNNCPVLQEQYM